ncbi:MAG: nucleoside-diphosphate sugar epimerase/dehydratase [Spirochaetes bacterium]|nr:nucleoside-diphosphate sugar epimerase/dehydratase [Spirochaetota bacterium]
MDNDEGHRLFIVGAGFAGREIAKEFIERGAPGRIVAFLDDDPAKIGGKTDGVPVFGPIGAVAGLVRVEPNDEAIIAMPSASNAAVRRVYFDLKSAGFSRIRILPGIAQIVEGDARLVQAREIDPQDLLGRDPVRIGLKESLAYLRGKRVLVTGAGGSIGSELARQLLSGGVERLYLLGHGENSIYQVDRELAALRSGGVGETTRVVPVVGELKDRDYVRFLLGRLKADAVFHAAAYKHVPLMEANPLAAIENNVLGTHNLVDACLESGTRKFVFISTDKAVDPVSIYGASKLLSERIVSAAQAKATGGASFMVVRFGNVLGSRGSIIPLFRSQIERGGPVTVTHPDADRYFMTIPEACSLVLKAGGVGEAGAAYVLDMGEPVRIAELAAQLIRFFGFVPGRDIGIEYVGLRPGERLTERLHSDDEEVEPTPFPGINRIRAKTPPMEPDAILAELEPLCRLDPSRPGLYRNKSALREIVRRHVPSLEVPIDESDY